MFLLHPFPASHEIWLPVAEQLSARYRVILPDLRAHGRSGIGQGPATMEQQARAVAAIMDELVVRRAVICGCSIGGYIAFECWRRFRERISALGLVSTRATPDSDQQRVSRERAARDVEERGPEPYREEQLPGWLGESTRRNRPDIVQATRRAMERGTSAGIAAALRGMAERPDSVATLATIDVPVLIIHGEEDTLVPMSEAEKMHKGLRQSSFVRMTQAGHYLPIEKADETARLLRQWLDKLGG